MKKVNKNTGLGGKDKACLRPLDKAFDTNLTPLACKQVCCLQDGGLLSTGDLQFTSVKRKLRASGFPWTGHPR